MKEVTHEKDAVHERTAIINPSHDIKRLGRDIESLHAMTRELATPGHPEKLLKIIPRNGWTTPAGFVLVSDQISHISGLVRGLEKAQTSLLRGADRVGQR